MTPAALRERFDFLVAARGLPRALAFLDAIERLAAMFEGQPSVPPAALAHHQQLAQAARALRMSN